MGNYLPFALVFVVLSLAPVSCSMLPPTFIKLRRSVPACSSTNPSTMTWSSGGSAGKSPPAMVHWLKTFNLTESYAIAPMGWAYVAFTLRRAQDVLISVVPSTFGSVEVFLTNRYDVSQLCDPPDLSRFTWHLTTFAGPMAHYPLVVKASDPRFSLGTYLLAIHAYVAQSVLVTVSSLKPGGIADSTLPYHEYQQFMLIATDVSTAPTRVRVGVSSLGLLAVVGCTVLLAVMVVTRWAAGRKAGRSGHTVTTSAILTSRDYESQSERETLDAGSGCGYGSI